MTTDTITRPRPLRPVPAASPARTRSLRALLHAFVAASVPIDGAWLPPQRPRPSTRTHPEPGR